MKVSQIAYGSASTVINSKQRVMVWANSDPVDGPLYLNFTMNVDKSKTIYLSNASGEIISQASYDPHNTNESFGYQNDNAGNWVLFNVCEKITATPGKANGSISCFNSELEDAAVAEGYALYPNPANYDVTISSKSLMTGISIFDVNGRKLQQYIPNGNEITIELSTISQGVYILQIESEEGVYTEKLVKQ